MVLIFLAAGVVSGVFCPALWLAFLIPLSALLAAFCILAGFLGPGVMSWLLPVVAFQFGYFLGCAVATSAVPSGERAAQEDPQAELP
jgi:hypothetical protein